MQHPDLSARERLNREEAQKIADTIHGYVEEARANLTKAQERMAKQANKHRRVPDFDVGDKVYIWKKV